MAGDLDYLKERLDSTTSPLKAVLEVVNMNAAYCTCVVRGNN